jgi:hypothetical protein
MTLAQRFHNYSDDHLLTRAEAAHIAGVSSGVLCNHSYAGLLPFIPGRPVHVRVGDLKVYLKMLANGHSKSLHRSLRIEHADRQAYSPLHGVVDFQQKSPTETINKVISETGFLWKKYKEQQRQKAKKAKKAQPSTSK